jgi:hypothetical protein
MQASVTGVIWIWIWISILDQLGDLSASLLCATVVWSTGVGDVSYGSACHAVATPARVLWSISGALIGSARGT